MKYRKRPIVVEALQRAKEGDPPSVFIHSGGYVWGGGGSGGGANTSGTGGIGGGAQYGAGLNRPLEAFAYANSIVERDLAPALCSDLREGGVMNTDKELLELAANAAGIIGKFWRGHGIETNFGQSWNPLHDDGDALRLAVELKLDIFHSYACSRDGSETCVYVQDECNAIACGEAPYGDDHYAATRRAIVMAAAEIGRTIK